VSAVDPADLRAVVSRYLDALSRFELEAAADCFTDDLFYSHPAYTPENGAGRHEVRGRRALIELFQQRGNRKTVHEVQHAALDGAFGFVAGTFGAEGTSGSFVSTVELAPDGRIARYAAYSSVPPVGDAGAAR
jgi:ketosteroid isomerase-like protein